MNSVGFESRRMQYARIKPIVAAHIIDGRHRSTEQIRRDRRIGVPNAGRNVLMISCVLGRNRTEAIRSSKSTDASGASKSALPVPLASAPDAGWSPSIDWQIDRAPSRL